MTEKSGMTENTGRNTGFSQVSHGDPGDDELSSKQYEMLGRVAISFLQGCLKGERPSIEEYVARVDHTSRPRMREVLEEVMLPLAALSPAVAESYDFPVWHAPGSPLD
jgi:hypothetical protein